MVKSMDFDINGFFSEIDRSLEASRHIFQRLDTVMMSLTEADWLRIEAKVCAAFTDPFSVTNFFTQMGYWLASEG